VTAVIIILLLAVIVREPGPPSGCPRLLALTQHEADVILLLTARPDCATFVTDSILAERETARDLRE
jgi:hypothetical protein